MLKVVQIFFIIISCFLFSKSALTQNQLDEKINARKLNYDDFMQYSIDDTSMYVIELFFDKKSNSAYGQMSFLPITTALILIPQTRLLGVGLTAITLPVFLNGVVTLYRYRKGKLLRVLKEYQKTKTLPNWVRRKAYRYMDYQLHMETDY